MENDVMITLKNLKPTNFLEQTQGFFSLDNRSDLVFSGVTYSLILLSLRQIFKF